MIDFGKSISSIIENKVGHINTIDIGVVDSLNEQNNTLNVSLMSNYESAYNDVTVSEIPTVKLYDIPVMRPGCRNFSIVPEYSIGDRVVVAFSKKDIISQLKAEIPLNMEGYTKFLITNAVVLGTIPKWLNFPPTVMDGLDTTVTIKHKNECTTRYKTDGGMYMASLRPVETLDPIELAKVTFPRNYSQVEWKDDGSIVLTSFKEESSSSLTPKSSITLNPDGSFNIDSQSKYGISLDASGNMVIKAATVNFKKV